MYGNSLEKPWLQVFHTQNNQKVVRGKTNMKIQLETAVEELGRWAKNAMSEEEHAWLEQLQSWIKELDTRRKTCRCSLFVEGVHRYNLDLKDLKEGKWQE